MSEILDAFVTKVLPRLAGAISAFLVGEAAKRGLTLDPVEVTTLQLGVYAFVHRLVSKYTNPGDATKTVLIERQKAIVNGEAP